jgi:hypothetical protein
VEQNKISHDAHIRIDIFDGKLEDHIRIGVCD